MVWLCSIDEWVLLRVEKEGAIFSGGWSRVLRSTLAPQSIETIDSSDSIVGDVWFRMKNERILAELPAAAAGAAAAAAAAATAENDHGVFPDFILRLTVYCAEFK